MKRARNLLCTFCGTKEALAGGTSSAFVLLFGDEGLNCVNTNAQQFLGTRLGDLGTRRGLHCSLLLAR